MAARAIGRTQQIEGRAAGQGREELVNYLSRQVVGPWNGPEESLAEPPHTRYLLGILFPKETSTQEMEEQEEIEEAGAQVRDDPADDPVAQANTWMPSSLGVSFLVLDTAKIVCHVWGATYERRERRWCRVAIAEREAPERVIVQAPSLGREPARSNVLGDRAWIRSIWRPVRQGYLVTVTLVNAEERDGDSRPSSKKCLFQVGLRCEALGGVIGTYPTLDRLSMDREDQELAFLHRRARVFALGHGCAATWPTLDTRVPTKPTTEWVETTLLPWVDVPAMTYEGGGNQDVLRLETLADPTTSTKALVGSLARFASDYEDWIGSLEASTPDIRPEDAPIISVIRDRLKRALLAIRRGIKLLENDPLVREAFQLANRVMLVQMRHSKEDLGGTRRPLSSPTSTMLPSYAGLDYEWRPFQLAFVLQCLASIADARDVDRDLVELLWFPTGGGKTEAYLGLSAFQILLRRFRSGNQGAGTTVITRYTLRLLTAQQFQRGAAMICALELVRRGDEARMGTEPVTIGLWIGAEQSPNSLKQAQDKFEEMLEAEEPGNPFVLDQCPWCGTELVPERHSDKGSFGVRFEQDKCVLFCPSPMCEFHHSLPVVVVDEDMYRRPPTFLLATVDKFARLAWVADAGVFFGSESHEPPGLVIQDEMHLLSGPLGTTVAAYEAAIDHLMSRGGVRPKVIASTATVRNAASQVAALFNRPLRVFPPPGLSASDSYFARTTIAKPGRRYLGVMAQSHTPDTSLVHLVAAMLQGPVALPLSPEELDAYWTLVIYHNSLRELGRTATRARDDVPLRIDNFYAIDHPSLRDIGEPQVVELTGLVGGTELTALLGRLKKNATDPTAIGVLATTNMISVGVDVPRLGLMMLHGQPKSVSEYIQASSRVGRADVPGLVMVMLNSTKPRDRSHYESFVPFHQALYRYVEPTSVTPFALPSRERSLRAALVILMRHAYGLRGNDAAGEFKASSPGALAAREMLLQRIEAVDQRELEASRVELQQFADEWEEWATMAKLAGQALYFDNDGTRQHRTLMKQYGTDQEGWPVLNSMRSVDRQCRVNIVPRGEA